MLRMGLRLGLQSPSPIPSIAGNGAMTMSGGSAMAGHEWSPAKDVSGLTLNLDANLGVTLNSGNVSGWVDQGPSAFSFTQTTGTKQPPLTASDSGFKSQPTFTFGSGQANLRGGLYEVFGAGATACTVVAVARTAGVGNAAPIIAKEYSADCWFLGEDFSAGGKIVAFFKNGAFVATANAQSLNVTHEYLATYSSGVSTILNVDGTAQTSTSTATGALPSTTDYVNVGAQDSGSSTGNYYNGRIAQILGFSRVLTGTEQTSVHTYCQRRFGTS